MLAQGTIHRIGCAIRIWRRQAKWKFASPPRDHLRRSSSSNTASGRSTGKVTSNFVRCSTDQAHGPASWRCLPKLSTQSRPKVERITNEARDLPSCCVDPDLDPRGAAYDWRRFWIHRSWRRRRRRRSNEGQYISSDGAYAQLLGFLQGHGDRRFDLSDNGMRGILVSRLAG